ncbi:hypothetical protein UlMin_021999 [Ulmus minor]
MSSPSPLPNPPPPPPPQSKPNLPMLCYGLIVVGTAAVVLALYNLLVIRWCTGREIRFERPSQNPYIEVTAVNRRRLENRRSERLPSFEYKKEVAAKEVEADFECAVCLSFFEEGEVIRKLPSCKHSFHADCIDMWLYSHSDCPLCRTPVMIVSPMCRRHGMTTAVPPEETSREILLNSALPV